jgi:hypothetical protein
MNAAVMGRTAVILLVIALVPLALVALIGLIVKSPRTGSNLSRAGLMEMQNLLEPERKIEIVRELERKEELLVTLDDQGGE